MWFTHVNNNHFMMIKLFVESLFSYMYFWRTVVWFLSCLNYEITIVKVMQLL